LRLVERHRHATFLEGEIGAVDQRQLHARFERGELGRLVRAVFGGALVDKAAAAQPSRTDASSPSSASVESRSWSHGVSRDPVGVPTLTALTYRTPGRSPDPQFVDHPETR
jgi:hypothetical protein